MKEALPDGGTVIILVGRMEQDKVHPDENISRGCRYEDVADMQIRVIKNFEAELKPRLFDLFAKLDDAKVFSEPIVTEISPLDKFFPAENYHQNYYQLYHQHVALIG